MMNVKSPIAVVLFLFAWLGAIDRQPPADSLKSYLEIAAQNNPTILKLQDEYRAALAKAPQAGSLPDPELSVGVYLKPMEQLNGDQVAGFQLMQMFPWFGVRGAARDEMELMARMKQESLRDAANRVAYDVRRSWHELYKTGREIHIAEKNVEILRTLERLALVKFKSTSPGSGGAPGIPGNAPSATPSNAAPGSSGMQGMSGAGSGGGGASSSMPSPSAMAGGGAGLADLYRIQLEIGELENSVALSKNKLSVQSARFNGYLNRPPQAPLSLPDTLLPDTLDGSLAAASDSMLKNNPMLGMLTYEQQSLDARRRMVTRMGYPMIGLGLNYSLINKSAMSASSMNGEDMIMPMVTLTLPVYRKRYSAMRAEANLLKTASTRSYEAAVRSLETEYYEALQLYQDARRRMQLYENQALLAGRTLDIMMKGFSASGVSLNDILRTRQQVLEYELKQVEAVADYNTAIAWLKRLMAGPRSE